MSRQSHPEDAALIDVTDAIVGPHPWAKHEPGKGNAPESLLVSIPRTFMVNLPTLSDVKRYKEAVAAQLIARMRECSDGRLVTGESIQFATYEMRLVLGE